MDNYKGRHYMQKQCFSFTCQVRFGDFWFFIKCFFQTRGKKDTVKCFFYSNLCICVNRSQVQYIFLKAVFSKWVFSPTLSHKSPLHTYTHQTLCFYSCLSWRLLHIWGACSYTTFHSPQIVTIYSGAKKYLVSHQLCKFSHLKRWERPVIFIIGIPQLWETK